MHKIGINLLNLDENYRGGVNTFALGILKGLLKNAPDQYRFIVYSRGKNTEIIELLRRHENVEIVQFHSLDENLKKSKFIRKVSSRLPFLFKDILSFLLTIRTRKQMNSQVDLMYVPYAPRSIFPYLKRPMIFSIHDLQHVHFPHFFSKEELKERNYAFSRVAKHAALLQASSYSMQIDFRTEFSRFPANKIPIIREGVDIAYFSEKGNEIDSRLCEIISSEYFYMPAQLWHHKNHITVIKGFNLIAQEFKDIKLILTGAPNEAFDSIMAAISDFGLNNRIVYLGLVDKNSVRVLYQNAKAVIVASLYESSSLPLLEAVAAQTNVIAGNTEPNIEISNTLEILVFSNKDPSSLASSMRKVLSSEELDVSQRNFLSIQHYSWDLVALEYLELFNKIIDKEKI
jgi:glycosyltransferase involved in cell wall biosynthesis